MENKAIAKTLRLLSQLMELHDENPFKVRSMANAAFKVDKLPFAIAQKTLAGMEEVEGLGKSTAAKIHQLLQTGTIAELENLLKETPQGIVEMMQVKGIGPKKVAIIWKTLGIENIGELLYACNENRLIEAKGFGLKTQEEIKKIIEFKLAGSGRFLYAHVHPFARQLMGRLQQIFAGVPLSFTGPYRRCAEIVDGLDILIGTPLNEAVAKQTGTIESIDVTNRSENSLEAQSRDGFSICITFCQPEDFGFTLLQTTGNEQHTQRLTELLNGKNCQDKTEEELYRIAGLPFIEPELREDTIEFGLAARHALPELITFADLKGTLHNHSTWSDGVNTLEEMALFCRNELKLEYLGICDHSRSAFYANGLDEFRVAAQHREIDELNKKLSPFHIFKGIESDILYDGSLDYPEHVLATFDFVVASVHSVLKMNEEKATERLIRAIENPFTTILGHPTGRMLLARSGYAIDYKKVIDACAANNVVIEVNSNPLRLDLDWRWHHYALEKGVLLAINPDAHRTEALYDMRFGVLAARKGGLSKEYCLNAMNLTTISTFFEHKKNLAIGKAEPENTDRTL